MGRRCSDCQLYRNAECMAPVPAIVLSKLGKDWGVFGYVQDEDAAEYCDMWKLREEEAGKEE